MLSRVLEPEVMDSREEAHDYDAMDHASVNTRFCEDFVTAGAYGTRVLDVGTGTARIPIELLGRDKAIGQIVAIDLAENMLALARENVDRAKLSSRVVLERVDAKAMPYATGSFTGVLSNSIIHHIPEPAKVFAEMWRVLGKGSRLFVRDLARPSTVADVDRLVVLYGGAAPADPKKRTSFERARGLFRASLCAALTVSEVAEMVAPLGIAKDAVKMTSDRHWTLSWRKT